MGADGSPIWPQMNVVPPLLHHQTYSREQILIVGEDHWLPWIVLVVTQREQIMEVLVRIRKVQAFRNTMDNPFIDQLRFARGADRKGDSEKGRTGVSHRVLTFRIVRRQAREISADLMSVNPHLRTLFSRSSGRKSSLFDSNVAVTSVFRLHWNVTFVCTSKRYVKYLKECRIKTRIYIYFD